VGQNGGLEDLSLWLYGWEELVNKGNVIFW
jgi:hypothetical protein